MKSKSPPSISKPTIVLGLALFVLSCLISCTFAYYHAHQLWKTPHKVLIHDAKNCPYYPHQKQYTPAEQQAMVNGTYRGGGR